MVGKGSTVVAKKAVAKPSQKAKKERPEKEKKSADTKSAPVKQESVKDNSSKVHATPPTVATQQEVSSSQPQVEYLKLKVSRSLYSKLKRTAQEEGLAIDDLAAELLTEGVVLRAWEIIERKAAMRSDTGHASGNQARGNNNFHRGHHHKRNHNQGGRRAGAQGGNFNSNMMDDRASFMEYVRNQDPNRR